MSNPFLDELFGEESAQPKKIGRKGREFDNPALALQGGAVERATVAKSLKAGQYIRRQFTFRPDQLARIKRLAQSLNVPETDLVRWLVDYGMNAIEREGVKPETVSISTIRLSPPK